MANWATVSSDYNKVKEIVKGMERLNEEIVETIRGMMPMLYNDELKNINIEDDLKILENDKHSFEDSNYEITHMLEYLANKPGTGKSFNSVIVGLLRLYEATKERAKYEWKFRVKQIEPAEMLVCQSAASAHAIICRDNRAVANGIISKLTGLDVFMDIAHFGMGDSHLRLQHSDELRDEL
jgi:hypothetical protein